MMIEREVMFTSLVGFYNYGFLLDNDEVNYYHAYVLPELEDFYDSYPYLNLTMINKRTCQCYDIRYFVGRLLSGDYKHIECLFSDNIDLVADFKGINFLFTHKDEIAKMNLKGLYKYLDEQITEHLLLMENYQLHDGYRASLTYHLMCFAEDFFANDFSDFKEALMRKNWEKKIMLDIYNKKHTNDETLHILQEFYNERFKELQYYYESAHEDNKQLAEEIKYEVFKTIYKFVK